MARRSSVGMWSSSRSPGVLGRRWMTRMLCRKRIALKLLATSYWPLVNYLVFKREEADVFRGLTNTRAVKQTPRFGGCPPQPIAPSVRRHMGTLHLSAAYWWRSPLISWPLTTTVSKRESLLQTTRAWESHVYASPRQGGSRSAQRAWADTDFQPPASQLFTSRAQAVFFGHF